MEERRREFIDEIERCKDTEIAWQLKRIVDQLSSINKVLKDKIYGEV